MNDAGSKQNALTTTTSAIKSNVSSSSTKVAIAGWQLVREMFPITNHNESDASLKLRAELFGRIVEEVGEERFIEALKQAISVSQRRYDVTVARVREFAGLKYIQPISATAEAWRFVTQIFLDHVRMDGNGNYMLEPKVINHAGHCHLIAPPKIPKAVKNAVVAIGGWAALADSYPNYWAVRYKEFKEIYKEDEN
jgi:hypothetical protein